MLKEEICLEIEGRGRVLGGLHAANQTRLLEQRVVAAQNSEEKEGAIEEDLRTAEDDFDEDSDIESDDEDVFWLPLLHIKKTRVQQ